jgi:hypothetical protein
MAQQVNEGRTFGENITKMCRKSSYKIDFFVPVCYTMIIDGNEMKENDIMTDEEEGMSLLEHTVMNAAKNIKDLENRPMDYGCKMAVTLALMTSIIDDCSQYLPDQHMRYAFQHLQENLRNALA